jgi:tol-pal system protein YbgF
MMFKRTVFAACLLASVAASAVSPARADDIATRIFNIENQIRQLTGQIEELNHSMQTLQQQIANGGAATGGAATQQQGDLQPAPVAPAKPKINLKKLATTEPTTLGEQTQAEAAIGETSNSAGTETIVDGTQQTAAAQPVAPKRVATISGILNEDGTQVDGAQSTVADGTQQPADGIEQVSLTPATETPEALYEKHYEALLRRQFGDAEGGFRDFLAKYPQHSLAGSAQFQLGETFYAQGKYEDAARNYLQGYKTYPKSRRAPDSLMKLGLSLGKLGQKEQACNALASVSTEFPRAVEVKKRADAEYKRGGC